MKNSSRTDPRVNNQTHQDPYIHPSSAKQNGKKENHHGTDSTSNYKKEI